MKELSREKVKLIHSYRNRGVSKRKTAKDMGIDITTVRKWWEKDAQVAQPAEAMDLKSIKYGFESHPGHQHYSYLLGAYLGDGYINLQNEKYGVYKFRIFQDNQYSNIIEEHVKAMEVIFPGNKVNIYERGDTKMCEVSVHSKIIPQLFPQIGNGKKHQRPIKLETWQTKIVEQFPSDFIRGLIQTDGCRYIHRVSERKYPKYNFTNTSQDIINLLCWACDLLSIHYTIHTRRSKDPNGVDLDTHKITVTFNRRDAVEYLDRIVGPKN